MFFLVSGMGVVGYDSFLGSGPSLAMFFVFPPLVAPDGFSSLGTECHRKVVLLDIGLLFYVIVSYLLFWWHPHVVYLLASDMGKRRAF